MDVRRLAAIDMYGGKGSPTRARIIRWEFIIGFVACVGLGLWSMIGWRDSYFDPVFGAYLIGVGINYLPLAVHATRLSRPGALAAELANVDIAAELRRYTVLQLWLLVPVAVAIMALRQRRESP